MVDAGMLSYYKNLYGGHKIIYVRFLDLEFVFRTLTKQEYKSVVYINSMNSRKDFEDAICQAALLYPEDYEFSQCGHAGIPERISSEIEMLSGFTDIAVAIQDYNNAKEQSNLETQAMDLIKAFIPEYTYEEMEAWTWQKLMETSVRAENIAKLKGFDWHLEDKSDDYKDKMSGMTSDNKEFINELYNKGVDPMSYFKDEIELELKEKHNIVSFPLISSGRWKEEGVLNAIRNQKTRSNKSSGNRG